MREFAIRDVFDAAEEATGARFSSREIDEWDGFDWEGRAEESDGTEPVVGYVDQDEPPAPPPVIVQHPVILTGKRLKLTPVARREIA